MSIDSLIPVSFANWSVLTASFLIILHLTIGGVTLAAILHLASAKWRYLVRDMAVSLFGLFPLAAVLLVILLLARHNVFAWMGAGAADHEEHALNAWHNPVFLAVRELGGLAVVWWLYSRFIRLQALSERSEADWERFKLTANFVPVAHVLYGTMVAWDFEMTMVPMWESSVYGMYHFVSNFGMMLSTMVVLCYTLNRSGALIKRIPDHIYNYFGQMMLAFTILWTYLFFAQYLTIWYGNIPDERDRIENMVIGDYSFLWWTFFTLKFLTPFLFLIFTYFRHSPSSIFRLAVVIIIGTWIERYTWIAGSVPTSAFTRAHYPFTSLFDIVVVLVIAAAAVLLLRRSLARNGVTRPRLPAAGVRQAA
jgi:hypothetical protein